MANWEWKSIAKFTSAGELYLEKTDPWLGHNTLNACEKGGANVIIHITMSMNIPLLSGSHEEMIQGRPQASQYHN